MNITEQILNPIEQPSLSEQVLNASEPLSITDQVLNAGSSQSPLQEVLYSAESPTKAPLETTDYKDTYLSRDASQEATEMSKHINGDNGPEIYTKEDLDEANAYEGTRVLEENDIKSINKTLKQTVEEGVQKAQIARAAATSAWDRFLSEQFKYDGGLRASDLRQHQAEAEANNDFTDIPVDSMQLYQNKIDIIHRIRKELVDKIYDRGYFKDFFTKYWLAAKNAIPGYDAAFRADMVSKGLLESTPAQNMRDLHKMWHGALTDDGLSAVQFETLLRASLTSFDIPGTTNEELVEYLDNMFNMSTGVATAALAADVAIVGGQAAKITSKTATLGAKAGALQTVKSLAPYLDAQGVKAVVRTGSSPIKTARNISKDLVDVVKRKRFVGDVKGAADTAVKNVGGPHEVKTVKEMKKLLGDPDITNTYNKDTKTVKTVIEDIMGELTSPTGSAVSDIAAEGAILTERAYRRQLRNTYANMQHILNITSSASVQEALKNIDGAFESSIEDMLYKVPEDLISRKKVGDLLKAIPAENFGTDREGSLVARIRLPAEFNSLNRANAVLKKINDNFAQVKEVIPLTNGKFAIEVDFNTHKGFGQILFDTSKGKKEWAGKVQSGLTTITGTPTPIRELDYTRSMETDFIERLAKNEKAIMKGLSKEDKESVELLQRAMQDPSKPGQYSPELLKAKGFSDKAIDAAMRLRELRDINFLYMNLNKRTDLMRDGMRTITVNGRDLGQGVIISATDPNKAAEFVKGSNKKLVIGHVDAIPVNAADLKEYADAGVISKDASNRPTRALAYKLSKGATKNQKIATEEVLKSGAFDNVYERIRKGEYVVLESIVSTDGQTSARDLLYILPKNSVVTSDLPAYVMNYVPGWNRYFDPAAAFVKQGRIDSTGKAIGVNTLFASTDGNELKKTVDKINTLRAYVAKNRPLNLIYGGKATTKTLLEKIKNYKEGFNTLLQDLQIVNAPFKNEEEFVKWAAGKRLDITHVNNPLEILANNRVPSVVVKGSINDGIIAMDKDTIKYYSKNGPIDAIQADWMQRQDHRYGGSLMNYDFSEVSTVDIDKTLQHFVNDMISEGVMNRYNEIYSNAFGDQFRDILIRRNGEFRDWTNTDILYYGLGKIEDLYRMEKDPAVKDKLSQAITAIKNHQTIRGVSTPVDQMFADIGLGILNKIGASADALHIPEKIQAGVRAPFEWAVKQRPDHLAQSIAAHRFLGMLNPVQFIKNFLGPASLIIAAELVHGAAAFKDVFTLFHRLQKQNKQLISKITKLDKALDIDSSKADIILRNLFYLDTHSAGVKGGLLSEAVKSENALSKASLFFFNSADIANRLMAYDTALRKFGFDTKLLKNPLDVGRVGAYGDSLYINMSKRGLSRLQSTEVSKTFTQFMGYMFKYVETMLCDKELTAVQRSRMALMTILTAGAGGLMGTSVYHSLASSLGFDMSDDDSNATRITKEIFQNGGIDAMIKEFGGDVSVQNLFGPNVLEKLDDFSNKGFLEIMAGLPAVNTITDYFSAATDLCHFLYNKFGEEKSYARWSDLLSSLLTQRKLFASAEKAKIFWDMYSTGRRYSSSGQLLSDDNTKLAAFFTLIGGDSQSNRDVFLSQSRRQEQKEYYQETVKEALKHARLGYAGSGFDADYANHLIWDNERLSWREKIDAQKTLNSDGFVQTGVPLIYREWEQSAKTKLKTGESTLK